MRCAAFNTGPDFHLLDHIAPLAALLRIPLITTEELNTQLASRFYPQVTLRHLPDLESRLGQIAREFDTLIECKYWQPHLKHLFRTLYQKEMQLVFCPHGQSDKGYQAPLLAPYATQDAALLYGPLHFEMLRALNALPPVHLFIGNYRLAFYLKHQSFYDSLAKEKLPLDPTRKTLLYAPTWRDADNATSFFSFADKVLAELPDDWNLILRPHPLLEQRDPALFYRLTAKTKPNLFLLTEFPPVYPVLALADAYLGDASSVGYDFLHFQRPLYFLPTPHKGKLHTCGAQIDPAKNLYSQIKLENTYREEQRKLYKEAFGPHSLNGGKMKSVCKSFKLFTEGRTSIS